MVVLLSKGDRFFRNVATHYAFAMLFAIRALYATVFDLEEGSATISANLPFTSAAASDGAVTVVAIDYLP